MRLDHLLSKEHWSRKRSRARSVPECGAAGAHGWNIDYLTPSRADAREYNPVITARWEGVESGWCGVVSDTLLGPEGSGDTHWVPRVERGPVVCGGWFLLVVGPTEGARFLVLGVGCRLYVENFTVDASIFVVSSF